MAASRSSRSRRFHPETPNGPGGKRDRYAKVVFGKYFTGSVSEFLAAPVERLCGIEHDLSGHYRLLSRGDHIAPIVRQVWNRFLNLHDLRASVSRTCSGTVVKTSKALFGNEARACSQGVLSQPES